MEILKKYHQQQLLNFLPELNDTEQQDFLSQLKTIDYDFITNLYQKSYVDETIDIEKIAPLKCISNPTPKQYQEYTNVGIDIVKQNQYAVVIMAGGNGTRLGADKPKGCFEIKIKEKTTSLFECFVTQLKEAYNTHKIYIPVYIMTSHSNYQETFDYFEKNNYFDYPQNKIKFFIQDDLPILDVNGKILLEDKNKVLMGPNGNGNVFHALDKAGLIDDMQQNNIKYVLFSTVDNILGNLVDYAFIGATIQNNYHLASKTIFKEDPMSKNWVFCKYNNKPFMLPSAYITDEISNRKDSEGNYQYREQNIAYHLISIDNIIKFANVDLKYHRSYKKYNYLDSSGNHIKPETNNAFKFEQFIFDAFYYTDDMLLYRINKEEFWPIKTLEDLRKFEELKNH